MPPFRQSPLSETEPEVKTPSNIDTHQEDAERLFSELPKPLQDRWQEKFDDLYGAEALDFITRLLSNREKARTFSTANTANLSPEAKSYLEAFNVKIMGAKYHPNGFLGDGKAATVYSMPENPTMCVKYMRPNKEKPKNHLSAHAEYEITGKVRKITINTGVKTPELFSYIEKNDDRLYVMETISGATLDLLIKNNLGTKDKLPTPEKFEESLFLYFKTIHNAGFTHYDLHGGNIMLDFKSKTPAVIDFGAAQIKGVASEFNFEKAVAADLRDVSEVCRRYRTYYQNLTNQDK